MELYIFLFDTVWNAWGQMGDGVYSVTSFVTLALGLGLAVDVLWEVF